MMKRVKILLLSSFLTLERCAALLTVVWCASLGEYGSPGSCHCTVMFVQWGLHIYKYLAKYFAIFAILLPPPHIHQLTQCMLLMSSFLAKTQAKWSGSYHPLTSHPSRILRKYSDDFYVFLLIIKLIFLLQSRITYFFLFYTNL